MALTDILVTCADENRRGGIKRLFVVDKTQIDTFTAGALQDYTASTLVATPDYWVEIQFDEEGASFTSESSKENGSSAIEYTIEASIPKIDKTKAFALQELFTSCKVVCVVETYISTGTYNQAFVVGYDEIMGTDAALSAAVSTTLEAELQGQNAFTVTLNGKHVELAREMVGTIEIGAADTVEFGS